MNTTELQSEIARLKAASHEQGIGLKARFKGPKAILQTAGSLFPARTNRNGKHLPLYLHPDWMKLVPRFVIPFALNKTLFRHSNFLVKMIVDLVSQKVANQVTTAGTEKLIGEGKSIFDKLWHKINAVKLNRLKLVAVKD